jgi:hypothetical protein
MGCHRRAILNRCAEITKRRKMRRGSGIANLRSTTAVFAVVVQVTRFGDVSRKERSNNVFALSARKLARLQWQPCHRGPRKPTRLWMRNSSRPLAQKRIVTMHPTQVRLLRWLPSNHRPDGAIASAPFSGRMPSCLKGNRRGSLWPTPSEPLGATLSSKKWLNFSTRPSRPSCTNARRTLKLPAP